jgi:hypothetical protein
MRKESIFKKLLLILLLAAFLSAATAGPALADCPTGPCIATGSFTGAIAKLGVKIAAAVVEATTAITAYYTATVPVFTGKIEKKILKVTDNITDWIDTFWNNNQKPSQQSMTDQLAAMNADQSREIASFREAADLNRTLLDKAVQEINSRREQSPDENNCGAATLAGGMTRSSLFRRAYNTAAPVEKLPRTANAVGSSGATGAAADMKERWDTYVTRYCRKDDNNGHAGCTTNGAFAGQDTDVTGMIFSKETIDLKNDDTRQTVDDLIANIAEPFVNDPVPPSAVNSATGQAAILKGQAYKAKRQTIYDSLYHIISRRAPGSNLKGSTGGISSFVKALRKSTGLSNNVISSNPSHNEIMQVMMSERFRDGKYSLEQIDEPENNRREMVIQQAFQVMQMSDQLDLMDRYSLMLAAQAGEEVRKAKQTTSAQEGAPLK